MIVVYGGDKHKEIADRIGKSFDTVFNFEPRIHWRSAQCMSIAYSAQQSRKEHKNILAHGKHMKDVDMRIRRIADAFAYSKVEFDSTVIVITDAQKAKLAPCYYFSNINLGQIVWTDLRKTPAGVLVAWDNL